MFSHKDIQTAVDAVFAEHVGYNIPPQALFDDVVRKLGKLGYPLSEHGQVCVQVGVYLEQQLNIGVLLKIKGPRGGICQGKPEVIDNLKDVQNHRKAIVRTMIRSINLYGLERSGGKAFGIDETGDDAAERDAHAQCSSCVVTGLFFPDRLAEMQTTCSNYGDIFMGLWLDAELKLDEDGHGNTLFPRWLAEVINEEVCLGIKEEDIYDDL